MIAGRLGNWRFSEDPHGDALRTGTVRGDRNRVFFVSLDFCGVQAYCVMAISNQQSGHPDALGPVTEGVPKTSFHAATKP